MKTEIYTKFNQEIETGDVIQGNYNGQKITGMVSRNIKDDFIVLTTQGTLIDLRDLKEPTIV